MSSGCARSPSPVELFYVYSHRDEELRDQLDKHLSLLKRQGRIRGWHDRRLVAGEKWDKRIKCKIENAGIILLLVSSDFLASDYIWDVELRRALERDSLGQARVIPVVLRACDWASAPFGKLQALPKDGKPVTGWPDRDEAFTDIAKGIRNAIEELGSAQTHQGVVGRDESQSANEQRLVEVAPPNLVLLRVENPMVPLRAGPSALVVGEPNIMYGVFANQRPPSIAGTTAKDVAGHMDVYDESGSPVRQGFHGRWSETREEVEGARPAEMKQIDLAANGLEHNMDILLKYRQDNDCYILSPEGRRRAPRDWRDPNGQLGTGRYLVTIRLLGSNADREFRLRVLNSGRGTDLAVEILDTAPTTLTSGRTS